MSENELIADLQLVAMRFDYYVLDETNLEGVIDVILDALQEARPEATPLQMLLAVRRAEFELVRMIDEVVGWDLYDDHAINMLSHMYWLGEVEINIEATIDDEVDYLLTELHDELGDRLLVLGPEDRLAAEIVLPPLVMIVDRNDAGPAVFDQPSLDRLLGVAKVFCVRCMGRFVPWHDEQGGSLCDAQGRLRSDARQVRDTAMDMVAGRPPRNCHPAPLRAGPAVLLVVCRASLGDFPVWQAPPDAWISAWEARGIDLY